jgi:hypothetical protein
VALLAERYLVDRPALGIFDLSPHLLRQGLRIQLLGEPPLAPYYIYLSRSKRRPFTQVWPISLHAALPTVPVPLLPADPDVSLDLQAAVQACFELVGYERLLDYSGAPPPPELSTQDAAWVDGVLRAAFSGLTIPHSACRIRYSYPCRRRSRGDTATRPCWSAIVCNASTCLCQRSTSAESR